MGATTTQQDVMPSGAQLLIVAAITIIVYYAAQCIYNVSFHPLAKYPGPRFASVSNLWLAYARVSGRYPWIIERATQKYGDVVRIAPNELVFLSPQAAKDIHLAQERHLELFIKTSYDNLNTGDTGLSGKTDPMIHREVAKKLKPAFSTKNLRAKEETICKHIDLFLEQVEALSRDRPGIDLNAWTNWLALDLSADMTYGQQLYQMRDMQDSMLLNSSPKLNLFVTMSKMARKLRYISLISYLTIPPSVWGLLPKLIKLNSKEFRSRIDRRGKTEHLDYFEQLIPNDKPVPTDEREIFHLENVAAQLQLASWTPLAHQFYLLLLSLLRTPEAYSSLKSELDANLKTSSAVDITQLGDLKYLQACVQESLRLHQTTTSGLARFSPGAVVDGIYVPKGVICQISSFAVARSPRFFTDPLEFHPERWLPSDHLGYNDRYKDDDLQASKPFGQGVRGCPGGAISMAVIRLFIAKVLLAFELELVAGQEDLYFREGPFRYLTYWERPPLWVKVRARSSKQHQKGVP